MVSATIAAAHASKLEAESLGKAVHQYHAMFSEALGVSSVCCLLGAQGDCTYATCHRQAVQ